MLSKEKTRKAFSRAAPCYDQYATWQQKIARLLVQQIKFIPDSILDLGCGTGEVAFLLKNKFPKTEIYGLDLAEGMIQQAEKRSLQENKPDIIFKVGDMERIDYPDELFGLIISNLSLQWLDEPDKCFKEIYRVLKPEGKLIFSTVTQGSQAELIKTYQKTLGSFQHQHKFLGSKAIIQKLKNNKFKELKYTEFIEKLYFNNFKELAYSIKNVGAKAQNAGFLTKRALMKLEAAYPKTEKGLPLSYKILITEAKK